MQPSTFQQGQHPTDRAKMINCTLSCQHGRCTWRLCRRSAHRPVVEQQSHTGSFDVARQIIRHRAWTSRLYQGQSTSTSEVFEAAFTVHDTQNLGGYHHILFKIVPNSLCSYCCQGRKLVIETKTCRSGPSDCNPHKVSNLCPPLKARSLKPT